VHDAIEPLTPLSPLPLALGLTHLRACSSRKYRSRSFGCARGSLGRESRQDHFPRRLVKGVASVDPGCLPSVRTLRRIRWPLVRAHWPYARFAAPVPRPHPRFWRRCDRWMKLSLHPGSSSEPHRYIDARPDSRSIPSPTQAPTFHRRRSPRLGPRSLDADRPFWSALPSLFEARCRLPTSATAYYDVRTRTQTLSFLAGTEAKTSFLFLRVIAFSLAGAVTRGEPRCVRSIEPRCRFLLVAQVCPTSMLDRPRHLRRAS
jgi:hypothetical protein